MEQTSRSTVKGSTNAMGKAYRMPNAELLNPSKRPRCLRRLFAPLLQKQEQLPKNLTLLLAEVRKCQAKMLPSLEELLQDCSMFHIPLHLPFQMIAHFIQRYLTKERSTVAMVASQAEEKLVEAMKRESPALQSFLRAHGQEEDPLDRLPTVERHRLAQEMWKSILASLTQHRDRHYTFLQDFSHLTTTSQSELHTMTHALADCTEASSVAMGQLEQDAKECVEVIKGMTMKTLRTVEEIRSEFRTEEDALRASLDRKLYRLQRSEAEQERLARRAREAVKAWMNEQLQYEETAQEVFQERLALAQLQTSYTQLQRSLQTCYAEALATDKRATQIRRMLKKSEKARQFLLTACRHARSPSTRDEHRVGTPRNEKKKRARGSWPTHAEHPQPTTPWYDCEREKRVSGGGRKSGVPCLLLLLYHREHHRSRSHVVLSTIRPTSPHSFTV